jgi:hypothetical protein
VIKTENSKNFIEDLQLVFNSLSRYRWKLNPEKCVFGVRAWKLLGFIVSHRGIEANLEKIEAIMRMEAPQSQKKVQRLTGCTAALSKFISRLGEKAYHSTNCSRRWTSSGGPQKLRKPLMH